MRVDHVITRMILGGAQENTLFTVEGLLRRPGYDVLLVTGPALGPEGELLARAAAHGVPVALVDEMRREIHPLRDVVTFVRLWSHFRRRRPDLVHTHSSKAGILGRAAALLAGVPVIVHTIHGLPFHPYETFWNNLLYVLAERLSALWSHRIICVADAMTEQALAAGVGRRAQFTTVRSGMEVAPFLAPDPPAELARHELGFSPDDVVFGQVARLTDLKGYEYLLPAFREIVAAEPRARLLLVGDGKLRRWVEEEARRLGIAPRLTLTGLVDPARIPRLIRAMDVVVHCSLREGLARVLPQALLSARPAVTFDVDGAREVVVDGETGFLVPPKDVPALVAACLRLARDPELRGRLGACGRERCRAEFSVEHMVERIDAVYGELLSRRGPLARQR
ncbi:MAG: glycosyltransferase family 4 protein [Planctomycetes bacterium]|nr:glycosyltransferase family 4 protein [Planctomycetota bacterium]